MFSYFSLTLGPTHVACAETRESYRIPITDMYIMYPLDRTILLGPSLEVHDFVEVLDVTTQLTKVDQSFYPSEMLDDSQVGC